MAWKVTSCHPSSSSKYLSNNGLLPCIHSIPFHSILFHSIIGHLSKHTVSNKVRGSELQLFLTIPPTSKPPFFCFVFCFSPLNRSRCSPKLSSLLLLKFPSPFNDSHLTAASAITTPADFHFPPLLRVMESKEKLSHYKVGSLPTLLYIPDFITDQEQTSLMNNIYGAPKLKWKSLKNRRLQNWGGVVHEKGLLPQDLPPWLANVTQKIYEESGLFPSAINHVLINEYLPDQGIMPHQDGPAYFPVVAILSIGSPVVMNFTPHSRFKSYPHDANDNDSNGATFEIGEDKAFDHHPCSILLMPRSLLIFKDKAYSDYLHGIEDGAVHCYDGAVNEAEALKHNKSSEEVETMTTDESKNIRRTSTRISLTCRLVPKVHKKMFRL